MNNASLSVDDRRCVDAETEIKNLLKSTKMALKLENFNTNKK